MTAGCNTRQLGFTLIELLIAMFIFGIVVSTVYGAYRATFTVINGSEAKMALSRSGQVALERIGDDLRSLVAGPGGELVGERRNVSGARGDRLTFVSASHLALNKKDTRGGWALIAYAAEPDDRSGLLTLYRQDRVLLPGIEQEKSESPGEILATGLKEVSFTYLDADGREADDWDSEEGEAPAGEGEAGEGEQPKEPTLPLLVYAKLVFARPGQDQADDTASEGGVVFKTAVALPVKAKGREQR